MFAKRQQENCVGGRMIKAGQSPPFPPKFLFMGSDWAVIEIETNVLVMHPFLAGLVPGLSYKADCVLAGAWRD